MDPVDEKILMVLSGDIEICPNIYEAAAEKVGVPQKEFLKRLNILHEKGYIKRISPILMHRKTEYQYNAMVVMKFELTNKERFIQSMLKIKNISHIYERKTYEQWPYNVYAMVHGRSQREVDDIVQMITHGSIPHEVLYTKREFKKISPDLNYFLKIR